MGTIAARDCLRILDLTETVAAIVQLAVCQAVDLREAVGVGRRGREIQEAVRKSVPMLTADRRQDLDIEAMLALYRAGGLPVGDLSGPFDQVS
jgi:histidine ammonia-lyase